jgi:hypothetical protein
MIKIACEICGRKPATLVDEHWICSTACGTKLMQLRMLKDGIGKFENGVFTIHVSEKNMEEVFNSLK